MGSTLDPVDLDAALRLGSLRPADLGSGAPDSSTIRLDDEDGLRRSTADPVGWSAVFGFYTPTLRTTDLDPGPGPAAAQHARGREDEVLRVILADDRSGTYVPREPHAVRRAAEP